MRLTRHFLERIEVYDRRGPHLNAVLEVNPEALEIAEALDRERASTGSRGPCTWGGDPETSGSILSPANQNSVVGIKPTVGLVSRSGIVPIAASQDTAGPLARTVADAAALLGVLAGADPGDRATRASRAHARPDYTASLDPRGLEGARVGVPRAVFFERLSAAEMPVVAAALRALRDAGATLV